MPTVKIAAINARHNGGNIESFSTTVGSPKIQATISKRWAEFPISMRHKYLP